MIILDGKLVAEKHKRALKTLVDALKENNKPVPGLAVILVGADPASQVYVRNKARACESVGFVSWVHNLPEDVSEKELKSLIESLNQDHRVHGLLVQLPLPASLNEKLVLSWIDPKKDVDALTIENQGLFYSGETRVQSCTPSGVMAILDFYDIPVQGKTAVVIGRSQIVGLPMFQLLQRANATVTLCHSKTEDLRSFTKKADILVVAAGRPELIGKEDVKKGVVVIDVGIHRKLLDSGKTSLCGDVKFSELENWAFAATPVPGGVGPMTICMLLENTYKLAGNRNE